MVGLAAVPGRPARDGAPAPVGSGSRAPGGPRCSRRAGEWQRGLARRGALFCPAAGGWGRTSASLASPLPCLPVLPVGRCPGAQPSRGVLLPAAPASCRNCGPFLRCPLPLRSQPGGQGRCELASGSSAGMWLWGQTSQPFCTCSGNKRHRPRAVN